MSELSEYLKGYFGLDDPELYHDDDSLDGEACDKLALNLIQEGFSLFDGQRIPDVMSESDALRSAMLAVVRAAYRFERYCSPNYDLADEDADTDLFVLLREHRALLSDLPDPEMPTPRWCRKCGQVIPMGEVCTISLALTKGGVGSRFNWHQHIQCPRPVVFHDWNAPTCLIDPNEIPLHVEGDTILVRDYEGEFQVLMKLDGKFERRNPLPDGRRPWFWITRPVAEAEIEYLDPPQPWMAQ